MRPKPFDVNEKFDVVELFDKRYLFSDLRVDRNTLPEGTVAYDVRDDCDGMFWQIKPFVLVNYWGTIIGFDPIELDESGGKDLTPEDWGYVDYCVTYEEFKKGMNQNENRFELDTP